MAQDAFQMKVMFWWFGGVRKLIGLGICYRSVCEEFPGRVKVCVQNGVVLIK